MSDGATGRDGDWAIPPGRVSPSPSRPVAPSGEHQVNIPPYTLWEVRAGDRGTPVVLMHGLSGSNRWWKRNIPALAQRHRVAAIDLVGFGRTRAFRRHTPLPPSFYSLVATLARWIEASFDEPVHLVGHSMGGQLALHLAARRPDLLRSLVLVDSTGVPFSLSLAARLRNLMYPAAGHFSFSPILLWDFLRAGPTSVVVATARLLADDARPVMRQVRLPTLILWGERDPVVPFSHAEQIKRSISGSRLIVLPRAGHVTMWDNPPAFNRALLDFLAEVDGATGRRGDWASRESVSPSLPVAPSPSRLFTWGIAGYHNGIAYRCSGKRPQILLIHGLAIGTPYFAPLARELHSRGWDAIAPDLPGCGYSANSTGPVSSHTEVMFHWLDGLELPPMFWVGHSTGCQLVHDMASKAPERTRGCVFVSPIWNRSRHPWRKVAVGLLRDAWREPTALIAHAVKAYWLSGIAHVFRLARHYVHDARREPRLLSTSPLLIAGENDPLIDLAILESIPGARVRRVPGHHGVVFSSAAAVAAAIDEWLEMGSDF